MREQLRKIVEAVYSKLSYTLDEEILDVLLDEAQHKLVRAPAGGTKTTVSQIWINIEKVKRLIDFLIVSKTDTPRFNPSFNMEEVVAFVYNAHNVPDIERVNRRIYKAFTDLNLLSSSLTSQRFSSHVISPSTIHSFAKSVIEDNLKLLKFRSAEVAKQDRINMYLRQAVKTVYGKEIYDVSRIHQLYQLYSNLMLYLEPGALLVNDEFLTQAEVEGIDVEPLQDVFDRFDKQKKIMKTLEFSDYLKYANELLANEKIVKPYQQRIKLLVADEIQDFTVLMFDVYRKMISDSTKTLAIGDSDQTVYGFNGASPDNIDKYEDLVGVKVSTYDLSINRRCAEGTFHWANNIITSIPNRVRVPITTTNRGGKFFVHEYTTISEEVDFLLSLLKDDPYPTSAMLYRTRNESLPLSRRLYKEGITTNYINAQVFFMHPVYLSFIDVVRSVFLEGTRDTWSNLYKILPFNKATLDGFLGFDSKGMPTKFEETLHWAYLDFSELIQSKVVKESVWFQIHFLQGLAEDIASIPTRKYMELLFDLFWSNYYKLFADTNDIYLPQVIEWLKEDLIASQTFGPVYKTLKANRDKFVKFKGQAQVSVCTIHATKGLEFDRVIMCSMEDGGIKGAFKSDSGLSPDTKRLYYVGGTRQKRCLVLSRNKNRPHPLTAEEFLKEPDKLVLEEKFSGVGKLDTSSVFGMNPGVFRQRLKLGEAE
jgi:DNA helicase-2/ATP-dependent DNA helicase PcrA